MIRWKTSRPMRLIDALKQRYPSLSARALKRSLEANCCRVNGRIERFASAPLPPGALLEFSAPVPSSRPSLTILFEDEELLVLDKPPHTVCTDDAFRALLGKQLYLAHRLDKDTTGVLLFAKHKPIADALHALFQQRLVHKVYLALVDGLVKQEGGTIRSTLAKKGSFQGQTIWGSAPTGLPAETHWSRLRTLPDATLLACRPTTGRTHQLRVHLAEMGHPLLIDRQYATHFRSRLFASRPLLHAHQLSFTWKQKPLAFEAPLPPDFPGGVAP